MNTITNILKTAVYTIPSIQQIISFITTHPEFLKNFTGSVPQYEPLFINTIQYRCQPNFIIVLTSGVVAPAALSSNAFSEIFQPLINALENILQPAANTVNVNLKRYIPLPDLNQLMIPQDDQLVRKYTYTKNDFSLSFDAWNNPMNHYGDYGLAFLSQLFNVADLKTKDNNSDSDTSNHINNTQDQEGKNWDAVDFPHQNITTITIATTKTENLGILENIINIGQNAMVNKNYLRHGSSYLVRIGKEGYFQGLSSIDEVKKVVTEAMMSVMSKNLSNSSSTILAKMEPYQGISAFLNTENWSSTLRFYALESHSNDFKANLEKYSLPDYGYASSNTNNEFTNRKILVSTGDKKPEFLKGDTAFNLWLIRPNDLSDQQINENFKTHFRERCNNKEPNCADRMLGDILNAPILSIDDNPNNRNRNTDPYSTFVVTAANDGMVHIFKKTNNTKKPYRLVLDYLPAAAKRGNNTTIWKQLPNLAHPGYGKNKLHPHQYFNNGGMAYLGTVRKDCAISEKQFICQSIPAQLLIVGSYGQGGRGLYALNIGGVGYLSNQPLALSNNAQNQWIDEIPLWESGSDQYGANQNDLQSKSAHQRLGYIIGSPVLANVALERTRNNELNQMKPKNEGEIHYAVITHNGFFSDDQSPTLYIFDALGITKKEGISSNGRKTVSVTEDNTSKGKLIAILSTNENSTNERNGLSAPAVLDVDNDGIADIVYAGDYNGNLYRFDLRKENPSKWTSTKIFSADNLNNKNPAQPITTAPVIYKLDPTGSKYVIMFGTGSDIFEDDLVKENKLSINIKPQTIYGIYDDINHTSNTIVKRSDLLQQTMTKTDGQFKE